MEYENTMWKWVHNAFQIGMARYLLLGTKENANLLRVDVSFSTLTNYFSNLSEFFRGYFQTCISWNNHKKVFLEKRLLQKFDKKKEEEW